MSWKEVAIGEVVRLRQGFCVNKKSNHLVAETGLPLLRITDMINGSQNIFIKEDISERFIAKPDDIIFTRTGQVGLVFRNQFGVIHNNCFTVSPNSEDLTKDYLYWFLRNDEIKKIANDYASGAAQLDLSHSAFKSIKIKYPTELPTQRKITSILSTYDDLIEINLRRIKLLEEMAFLRFKGIVMCEKEIKKLPLAQLATVTSSKRIFQSDYVEGGIPFYRSKEIIAKSNFESVEKPLYITEERYTDIKEKFGVPVSGDLLITSVGTIGFVHLVNDDDGDFYFKDGNLIWIKNLNRPNLAYFLFFKFKTPDFKEMLNSVAIGSNQKALTIETVKKIEIEIPCDDSLIEFNQETRTIIKFIYNLQKQNTKLREARDILLPRLLNGQIEV